MPFPDSIREDTLVRSGRRCCVCHEFAGRAINVHHIIQEADGGPNAIDNAIVLCLRCHSEAGHFNSRYPIGTKYSPSELRRHRDNWWISVTEGRVTDPSPRIEVKWKRTFLSGDLHTHNLLVQLHNGCDTSIERWKFQCSVPCFIPLKATGMTRLADTQIAGVRYLVHEVTGGPVLPGEPVELIGTGQATLEYQMTHEVYYASSGRNWVIAWRFFSSESPPIEGSRAWDEMHQF
jgi:hypothetical protein